MVLSVNTYIIILSVTRPCASGCSIIKLNSHWTDMQYKFLQYSLSMNSITKNGHDLSSNFAELYRNNPFIKS